LKVGSSATARREPGQVRKEAAISESPPGAGGVPGWSRPSAWTLSVRFDAGRTACFLPADRLEPRGGASESDFRASVASPKRQAGPCKGRGRVEAGIRGPVPRGERGSIPDDRIPCSTGPTRPPPTCRQPDRSAKCRPSRFRPRSSCGWGSWRRVRRR